MNAQKSAPEPYLGPLADGRFEWMHRSRLRGLVYVCRLPECTSRIVRLNNNRRRWYCGDACADMARDRRQKLQKALNEIDAAIAHEPRNADGRYRTERGRELFADQTFLRRMIVLYE